MCGRYVAATPPEEIAYYFDASPKPEVVAGFRPSYNVAPTDQALVVVERSGERVVDQYRWGLIPSWAKDESIATRMFNARAETLTTKAAFRGPFRSHRLIVVADGFYEWRKGPGKLRQPYFFSRADGAPLAFAGLWAPWRDPRRADGAAEEWVRSTAIITTAANDDVAPLHDRMPVILSMDDLDLWLDPSVEGEDAPLSLLRPAANGELVWRPVSARVGDVRNNEASLTDEAAIEQTLAMDVEV